MSLDTFVNSQRSEHTKRAYRKDLEAWFEFLGERTPDEAIVIEWRDSLEAGLANASALRRYNTARTYYRWLDEGRSPFERVKAPRRVSDWSPVVPNEQAVDKMLSVCDNPRDRAIMSLLNNGLRAQEVCDLKESDYYFDPRYQMNILRVTGKGMKMRLVPANSETVTALENVKLPFRNLNTRKVYYIVEKWSDAAQETGLHPHSLRHGYATRLVRAGVPVFSLQRLLGHTRAETTGVYVNLDLGDLVDAAIADPRHDNRRPLRVLAERTIENGNTREIAG